MSEYEIGQDIQRLEQRISAIEEDIQLGATATGESQIRFVGDFTARAPGFGFSRSKEIARHFVTRTFVVTYRSDNPDKVVIGEVSYVDDTGRTVSEEFEDEITFTTGNFHGKVTIRFKQDPSAQFGVGVSGNIDHAPN